MPKVIGRDEEADIIVEDRNVSRRHCTVAGLPNGVRVQDLDSTNGIWVNGKRVASATLKNGDKLVVGDITFIAECETPMGFSTAIRKVEDQFAFGKGYRTILGEIAAEARPTDSKPQPSAPTNQLKKMPEAGQPPK
ncbi:MAG: FHA domain-containing protein [Verrucomicrobia bacterium]|nr:FHA domain-containing protein [Verrucomicrobiota bacterium]